ncbi:MAG: hypothetical protein HQK91_00450 [Nitrospirae bacterium]|nr:hypothetical protein [Nitrospirota bacterium]MBF0539906.1 hypothetical protein [Nitrospirota bacterium]
MTTMTFDTLTYVKKLRAAGVSEEQAEVQAETIKELVAEQQISTQDHIKLETHLDSSINKLDSKIDKLDIKIDNKIDKLDNKIDNIYVELKSEIKILRWMMGLMLTGMLSLVLKAFASSILFLIK